MASSFPSIGVRFTAAVRPLRVGTTNRTHVRRTVHHHAWACRCRHGGPPNRLPASRKPGSAASTTRPSPGAERRYCCAIPRRKGAHDEVDNVSACSWGLRAQHGTAAAGQRGHERVAFGDRAGGDTQPHPHLYRGSNPAMARAPPSGGRRACAPCSPPSRTRRRLTSSPPTRAGRSARTAARPPRRVPAAPAGREAALPLEEHAQRRPERTPRRALGRTGEKPAG